ncbi:hypothetical protein V8E51_013162 [Hyaloscypha variabilis]
MAEAVCLRLLELERKILGDQHKSTLETIGSLRQCLKKQGNHAAIEYLDRTVFKLLPKFYYIGHDEMLQAASRLESTYEQESESDIDTSSENNSGKGQGEDNEEDEDEDLDCSISDVLQELAYVLAQQGKEEEANVIKEELAVEEAAGQRPWLWEDID